MLQFTNRAYDILKPIALIWLPAAATIYTVVAAVFGLGDVVEVVGALSAIDGALGTILHISVNPTATPSKTDPASSGQLVIDKTGNTPSMYLVLEQEIADLEQQKSILLKVTPKS